MMGTITFPWCVLMIIILFLLIMVIFSPGKCPRKNERYSLGVSYADPRMTPEFPTYDHLTHSNIWTRYDLENDKDPYSPYLPCWDCGSGNHWPQKGWGTLGEF